jgi:hypothetical protein
MRPAGSFAGMALLLLVLRPRRISCPALVTNQALIPGLTNLVRWQNHWHVVRQGWTFFQNDFAGRIANRVMQTGPALRESVVSAINAVWYILVYGTSAALLLGRADWRLALPIICWFATYAIVLRTFLPRMRERSRRMSEMRSEVTGRVVDSYTNILTVKLFARARDEDQVRPRVDRRAHRRLYRRQLRMTSAWGISLILMNASLLTGTGGSGDRAVGARAHPGRHGGDGDPDGLADRQYRRLGGAADRQHLRQYRPGAGRHALDRGAAADADAPGAVETAARGRRGTLRECAFRLRPRASGAAACCAGSTSMSRRASASGWSAAPAPANRRSSTCCSASTGRSRAAS